MRSVSGVSMSVCMFCACGWAGVQACVLCVACPFTYSLSLSLSLSLSFSFSLPSHAQDIAAQDMAELEAQVGHTRT